MINESSSEIKIAIKELRDLTARIDERVKTLVDNQEYLEDTVGIVSKSIIELQIVANDTKALWKEISKNQRDTMELTTKVNSLIPKVNMLEENTTKGNDRWKMFIDYVIRAVWVIFVCYMLVKLHLQAPPILD
jgi:hypothetical protein